MYPQLISLGGWTISSYYTLIIIGLLTGLLLGLRFNKRLPQPYPIGPMILVWGLAFGLTGSRLYWILQYDTIWHAYRALFIWQGGMVLYGGTIGGMIGFALYFKYKKVPVWDGFDIIFIFSPLGQVFGRIGCFLGGCCAGKLTNLPWGVQFPRGSNVHYRQVRAGLIDNDAMTSLPVHPAQLYEVIGCFLIFLFLRWLYTHKKHDGIVMLLYFTFYGGLRFVVEHFRGDSVRSVFGIFTVSQTIALTVFILGGITFLVLSATVWRDHAPKTVDAKTRCSE